MIIKKLHTTLAIIHCGFVPHQNKSINQPAGFRRNNPNGFVHNEIIA